jgi:hypothetical protein
MSQMMGWNPGLEGWQHDQALGLIATPARTMVRELRTQRGTGPMVAMNYGATLGLVAALQMVIEAACREIERLRTENRRLRIEADNAVFAGEGVMGPAQ